MAGKRARKRPGDLTAAAPPLDYEELERLAPGEWPALFHAPDGRHWLPGHAVKGSGLPYSVWRHWWWRAEDQGRTVVYRNPKHGNVVRLVTFPGGPKRLDDFTSLRKAMTAPVPTAEEVAELNAAEWENAPLSGRVRKRRACDVTWHCCLSPDAPWYPIIADLPPEHHDLLNGAFVAPAGAEYQAYFSGIQLGSPSTFDQCAQAVLEHLARARQRRQPPAYSVPVTAGADPTQAPINKAAADRCPPLSQFGDLRELLTPESQVRLGALLAAPTPPPCDKPELADVTIHLRPGDALYVADGVVQVVRKR